MENLFQLRAFFAWLTHPGCGKYSDIQIKKLTLTLYARFHYNLLSYLIDFCFKINLETEIIALHFTYLEEKDTWQLYQSVQTKYMWHLSGGKTIGNPIKCCTEVVPRRNLCFLSISEIWLPKDSSRGSAQLTLWIPILKFCHQCQRKVIFLSSWVYTGCFF